MGSPGVGLWSEDVVFVSVMENDDRFDGGEASTL